MFDIFNAHFCAFHGLSNSHKTTAKYVTWIWWLEEHFKVIILTLKTWIFLFKVTDSAFL